MFYRVTIDLAFANQGHAAAVASAAIALIDHAQTINPGEPNEERGRITLQECYHDEEPSLPCQIIEHYETSGQPPL